MIDGITYHAHVNNTARLETLLVPKAKVTLQKTGDTYHLISVYRPRLKWINVDGLVPRELVKRELNYLDNIETDYNVDRSVFDIYGENEYGKFLYDVEGCTLIPSIPSKKSFFAFFPDEDTDRPEKNGLRSSLLPQRRAIILQSLMSCNSQASIWCTLIPMKTHIMQSF